jgi:hypothetical protein
MKTQFCLNKNQNLAFNFSLNTNGAGREIIQKPVRFFAESSASNVGAIDPSAGLMSLVSLEIYFTICFSFMLGYILTST